MTPANWRLRIFYSLNKALKIFFRGFYALYYGFWLGLLDKKYFYASVEDTYNQPAFYRKKDYNFSGLFKWEERAVDRYFKKGESVLVGAVGAGREAIALAQRGFEVVSFECNRDLYEWGKKYLKEVKGADIYLSPPNEVPSQVGSFDSAILGWGAYSYVAGRENRIAFLREFRRHLPCGAPLLLSFFTRHHQSKYYWLIYQVARFFRQLRMSSESVEVGDSFSFHTFQHHFTRDELEEELSLSGFALEEFDSDYKYAVARALKD